jgi:hypothetical protein
VGHIQWLLQKWEWHNFGFGKILFNLLGDELIWAETAKREKAPSWRSSFFVPFLMPKSTRKRRRKIIGEFGLDSIFD